MRRAPGPIREACPVKNRPGCASSPGRARRIDPSGARRSDARRRPATRQDRDAADRPYVDVGLLSRVNRFDYRYELTADQRGFFQALTDTDDADVFLNEKLAGLYVTATGIDSRPATDKEIWDAMAEMYPQMRSSLGYASFTELAVVAAASLLDASAPAHFEIADGVRVLKERQKSEPARVKFGVKRGGGLRYVKLGRRQGEQ
ncbi:hypothetical protein ACE2AJ_14625 [Aquihabitans daechungensis]|uniref:hypothetical protein n=1 Tax=Aquihabitans daechungensis TaxID=1052257 RepID=UPI003B9F6EEC